ncbi:MAG: polyphosphate kinase 1 [Bacteroidota bacterium]
MVPYVNREKSWLLFNDRVMQEAEDESVPLVERIRFLGIFSNNLDEFFRVRYAYVRRISLAGKSGKKEFGMPASELLDDITTTVLKQHDKVQKLLDKLIYKLRDEDIYVIDEKNVTDDQVEFIRDYFIEKVAPSLMTIMLDQIDRFPNLKDEAIYLAIEMQKKNLDKEKLKYSLIEIPTHKHGRFIVIPSDGKEQYIMLLDDLIRFNMDYIFRFFDYHQFKAATIKITRDAELDIDNDISRSFIDKVSRSLKKRVSSEAVRLIYEDRISENFLNRLKKLMGVDRFDNIAPGGRYHNKKDYMKFPNLGPAEWEYEKVNNLPIVGFDLSKSLIDQVKIKDYLLYTPYHNFSYLISFLKEAALDPKVQSIKITLYRVADDSRVVNALINAARNGKKVIVQIELRARFDEAANIFWAEKMKTEGIELIFGVKGLKVHSKICIIERKEASEFVRYGFISTGNFNESTAKVYTDYTLFTSNQLLLKDVDMIFDFFNANYRINKYKHLIVSPHFTRKEFERMINNEIAIAKNDGEAYIHMRMNSLVDVRIIDKLYEASSAGVKIRLIVRGICSLIPGVKGLSENIEVISVVDKFLEHPRVYIFGNGGREKVFISSADLMTRNLDHRVEVTCPILDKNIQREIRDTFDIIWNDNTKARVFSEKSSNKYRKTSDKKVRTHFTTFEYYKDKIGKDN